MPRLMLELAPEELKRLRDRSVVELRHPRDTARLMLRQALSLPTPADAASEKAAANESV